MKILLLLLFMVSCGGTQDRSRCIKGSEMRLRCQADAIATYQYLPDFKVTECNNRYAEQACY